MDTREAIGILRNIKERGGKQVLRLAYQAVMREPKVNPDRDKRTKFPRQTYDTLYARQGGKCACPRGEDLLTPSWRNEIDHKDPNRSDFNHKSNLQLLLPQCNKEKGGQSIPEQSKRTGRMMKDLV